jgi:hypothetical protein
MSVVGRAGASLAVPVGLRSPSPEAPCYLLIPAAPSEMEDPSRLEAVLSEARQRGLRIVVRLLDEEWLSVADWSARITGFAQRWGDRVDAYQLLGLEAAQVPPREYAFLLKNARVAVRAAGSPALIVGPPLQLSDLPWAEQVFLEDAAPYLDVVAARDVPDLDGVTALRDRRHARAPVWITDAAILSGRPVPAMAATYLESLAKGAELVLFATPPGVTPPPPGAPQPDADAPAVSTPEAETAPPDAGTPEASPPDIRPPDDPGSLPPGEALSRLRALFIPGLRAAAPGALPFDPSKATGGGGDRASPALDILPFFDPETRDGIAAYRRAGGPGAIGGGAGDGIASAALAVVRLTLRAPLESLEIVAPETGESRVISGAVPAGAVAELPLRDTYLLLPFRLAASAIPLKERAQVGATSELTAEEIIAREREVRGVQDARLTHYEARATMSIHYRVAQLNESIDLSTENRLYVKDGKQDYEQTALYVNGALWRGKSPPYLPYIQPGTVGEVPLDIALDERYHYRLEGREKTDGRECYVLSFDPEVTTESLYRGRVFIDAERFVRLRMEAKQVGLVDPVRSNEVIFRYGPVPAPWGEAWLPAEMTGQMTFEVLGYNLVVEREATYSDYQTNLDGFETRRAQAYESGRPLFRETDSGLFRLDTTGGQETLRSLDTPRNTLLVFGTGVGDDGDFSFPFAGVNFFDFNFRGSGTQFNLAWAGPYADLAWTQPNLFDSPPGRRPISLVLQGSFNAVETDEENQTSEDIPQGHEIEVLRESMRAGLAFPMGNFFKTTLETRALYQNFDDGQDPDETFVLPVTHVEGGLILSLDYARLGYLVTLWGEGARRSQWERWGFPDQSFDERQRDFTRLGMSVRKAYYIGTFNKLSFGVTGYEGRGLDRFSRFELGDFRSARVQGFNGSGIHFDRGLIGQASCSFPMGKALRADLGVQQGFIHSEDDFGQGYERVTGSGLSLEFSGPWSTFVTVRVSYGVASTIEDTTGGGDLRVVFYRTFDRWSRRGGPGTPPRATPPETPPAAPVPPAQGGSKDDSDWRR